MDHLARISEQRSAGWEQLGDIDIDPASMRRPDDEVEQLLEDTLIAWLETCEITDGRFCIIVETEDNTLEALVDLDEYAAARARR